MAIYPTYYTKGNTSKIYLGGLRPHFIQKDRTTVLQKTTRILEHGEDMYSLAKKLFGNNGEHFWVIVADINELRMPTDWESGETVFLPEIILSESFIEILTFKDVKSTSAII